MSFDDVIGYYYDGAGLGYDCDYCSCSGSIASGGKTISVVSSLGVEVVLL